MSSATATTDTIIAVATPPGHGGIGVLRLSGPRAAAIAEALCGPLPPPRQAGLRGVRDADGHRLDEALLLHFPAPASFTGEDVVEIHAHGAPVVLELIQRAAVDAGARRALPGEFSERAFLNDRIDLAQAEAIADLIAAGTESAARAARASLDGALSREVETLASLLVDLRVWVEGALDFSDEDVDWLAAPALREKLVLTCAALDGLLESSRAGVRLGQGLRVALAGAPNTGKSTLLNRLAQQDLAIVTDVPGTTRDLLRADLSLGGLPLQLIDTAGLRSTEDVVEREGIRRTRATLAEAEVVLWLIDDRAGASESDRAELEALPPGIHVRVLRNKIDLSGAAAGEAEPILDHPALRICAQSGAGLDTLARQLLEDAGLAGRETPFTARARHVEALERSSAALHEAVAQIDGSFPELAAESLRAAHDALAEITGRYGSEALLGEIFRRFCIGK
jgi:tRNA modification GTPase